MGVGLGRDGGMAEYMTVPVRNLVPLGEADPVAAWAAHNAALRTRRDWLNGWATDLRNQLEALR